MSDSSERLLKEVDLFLDHIHPLTPRRSGSQLSCNECVRLKEQYSEAVQELRDLHAALKTQRDSLKRGYKDVISCERDLQVQNVQADLESKEKEDKDRKRKRQANAGDKTKLKEIDKFLDVVGRRGHGEGLQPFINKCKQAKKSGNEVGVFQEPCVVSFVGEEYVLKDPLVGEGLYNLPYPNLYEVWFECERLKEKVGAVSEETSETTDQEKAKAVNVSGGTTQDLSTRPFDFKRSPLLWFRSYRVNDEYQSVHGLTKVSSTYSNALDPHVAICRFSLAGNCRDAQCPFQHVDKFKLSPREVRKQLVSYSNGNTPGASKAPAPASLKGHFEGTVKINTGLFQHFGSCSFQPSVVITKPVQTKRVEGTPKGAKASAKELLEGSGDYLAFATPSGESEDESDDWGNVEERYFTDEAVRKVQAVKDMSAAQATRVICDTFFPRDPHCLENPFLPSTEWFKSQTIDGLRGTLNEFAHVLNSDSDPGGTACVLYTKLYLANLLYSGDGSREGLKEAIDMLNNFISGLPTSVVLWSIYRSVCPYLFTPFAMKAPLVNAEFRTNLKYVYFNILGSCNVRCVNMVLALHRKSISAFRALLPKVSDTAPSEQEENKARGRLTRSTLVEKSMRLKKEPEAVLFCRSFASEDTAALKECLDEKRRVKHVSKVLRAAGLMEGDAIVRLEEKEDVTACVLRREKHRSASNLEESELEIEEIEKRVMTEVLALVDAMGGSCLLDDLEKLLLDADLVCLRRQLPRQNAVDYSNAHALLLTSSGLAKAQMSCWRNQPGLRFDLMKNVSPLWRLVQPWCPTVFTTRRDQGKWVLVRSKSFAGLPLKETALFDSLFPSDLVNLDLIQQKRAPKDSYQIAYVDAMIQFAHVLLSSGYSHLLETMEDLPKLRLALRTVFPRTSQRVLTHSYSIAMQTLCEAHVLALNEIPSQVVAALGVIDEEQQIPVVSWQMKRKGASQIARLEEVCALLENGVEKILQLGGCEKVVERLLMNLLRAEVERGGLTQMKQMVEKFKDFIARRPNADFWRLFMRTSGDSDEAFALMASTCLKKHSNNPLLNWINVTDALLAQNDQGKAVCTIYGSLRR